jgi:hypothetical protein
MAPSQGDPHDAAYVQGATIDVNGGLLAHLPGAAGSPALMAKSLR